MDANVKASLLKHIAKAEGGMLMDNMQAALGLMLRAGLAYKARVTCAVIGVHEDNRDGVAIDVQHMQTLIQSISGMGWVEDEGKRVAIELQDDAESDKTRAFNMKLHLESGGKLPRADAGGPLRYATIMGSHANMASRALLFGSKHHDQSLTDAEGNLSLDRAPAGWRQAIKDGQEWTILTRSVAKELPEIIPLLQSSGNASQQVAKPEDELQMTGKILAAINKFSQKHGNKEVLWIDIKNDVLRSRPRCAAICPAIFGFVVKYGGRSFMSETESFIRAQGVSKEIGDVWGALQAETKGDARVAWRHMLLKYAFFEVDRHLSVSEVSRMQDLLVTHCFLYKQGIILIMFILID